MRQYIIPTVICLLMFSTSGFAQQYQGPPYQGPPFQGPPHQGLPHQGLPHQGLPQRMSQQEASVIAEYWINSYLRRDANPAEVKKWADWIMNAQSPADALSAFLASPEYYNHAGNSRRGFIRQLILDVGHHEGFRFEIEGRLQVTAGMSLRDIAYNFLREYPANWWPGPAATPPQELRFFYHQGFVGPPPPPQW